MTKKIKKPTTVEEWEKVCDNLNSALKSSIKTEEELIRALDAEKYFNNQFQKRVDKLEDQLVMSHGVIKYLEMKLERPNSV